MNEFDSSDDEPAAQDQTNFEVSWLSLQPANYAQHLGICSLPEEIKNLGIQDVFVFCTTGELSLYRVPTLLQQYERQDFTVHHHPFPDGGVPQLDKCCIILKEIKSCLDNNQKCLMHCYGGLGRSCLIAASLLLYLCDSVTPQEAITHVRSLRGTGAIQTIKQYNFLNEFHENLAKQQSGSEENNRSVSR
ncbi:cyclin-dependent kinase inhibitor 3 isoform 2-T4 [Discoglossus pictus]